MHVIVDATTTQDEMAYHGIGQYTKNVVLGLLKNYSDLKITLLLFDDTKSTLDDYIKDYGNVEVSRLGKYRSNNFLNGFYYLFQFYPRIKKIKRKDSVYFCPYFWRNFPARKIPTVLFVHDMNLARFNMYSQRGWLFNLIRKNQYWRIMRKSRLCKYILCNSQVTKDDYLNYFPKYPNDRVVVSHLGVDIEKEEVDISDLVPNDCFEKGYLIYLGGGVNRSKNSEGVIKSYYEFLKNLESRKEVKFSDAPYLVISGKSFVDKSKKEVHQLHELINSLDIEDKVVFTGFYKDEQRYSLLKNAFAFIHLSLYEGFGISVVEAMRSGVPVVVHESDVYKEVVGEGGIFVDGTKEKRVGEVLFKAFIAENFTKDIAQIGYERSLRYTWDNTAQVTYDVFNKLCG